MKIFKVDKPIKLSKFLNEVYGAGLPYSSYKKLLRNKDIKINGIRINKDVDLIVGDDVVVYFDGTKKTLDIIYNDDNLIILNKPSGITTEDFYAEVQKTYSSAIMVHRLDRNTSGLIIFALNNDSELELLKAFKKRSLEKFYVAEIHGFFEKESGVLKDYLFKDSDKALVKVLSQKLKGSVEIITEYETILKKETTSILKIKLITGKTHQIRAHLAYYNHFIIGDGKYGVNDVNKQFKAKYQRLCSSQVNFISIGGCLSYLNGKTFKLNKIPF